MTLEVNLAGVILNRLGSKTHEAMLREAMREIDMPILGALRRDDFLHMPERHLGLLPAAENEQEQQTIDSMGAAVAKSLDIEAILHIACLTDDIEVPERENRQAAKKCRIGHSQRRGVFIIQPVCRCWNIWARNSCRSVRFVMSRCPTSMA